MTGRHSSSGDATGAGELDYLQDTVKFIGGVASKIWTVGADKAKELLLNGNKEGCVDRSEEKEVDEEAEPVIKSFEDLDMLVSNYSSLSYETIL